MINPGELTDPGSFIRSYFEAAFFTSMDESNQQGGEPLDQNYTIADLAPATRLEMIEDCEKFLAQQGFLLIDENLTRSRRWSAKELGGHDFWLTRNGHGAGFWDGDWKKEAGDRLTLASEAVGSFELYLGDDGKIYA